MKHKSDDKHALRLDFWTPDDYDIEVIHPQSCKVWWGCTFRGPKTGWGMFDCPPYHHAHSRYNCPLGYMIENIGLGDTLFNFDPKFEEESLELLRRYMELPVPIHYDYSWGVSGYYEPEYDEELIWEFAPYYTHQWRQDAHICSVCHSTKQYVFENKYRCEVPNGQPE